MTVFRSAGPGNWFGLPEYKLTEALGGNQASVTAASERKTGGGSNVLGTSSTGNFIGPVLPPSSGGSSAGNGSSYIATSNYSNNQSNRIDEGKEDDEKAAEEQKKAINAAIESEYNNIMGTLAAQEQQLQSQLPVTEGMITQSFNEVLPALQQEEGERVQGLEEQGQGIQTQEKSTISSARRLFNELITGGQRFAGTSTGQAFGELLGRSASESIGQARQFASEQLAGIAKETQRVKTFYDQKRTDLERNRQLALQQARADFQAELNKISQAKRAAQSEKAARNLQALANFQGTIAQIRDAARTAQNALDQWTLQRNETLRAAQNEVVKGFQQMSLSERAGLLGKLGLSVSPGGLGTLENASRLSDVSGVVTSKKEEEEDNPFK